MKDFFKIAGQRAKSLQDLRIKIQDIANTTSNARDTHESAAVQRSLYDTAADWATISRQDAFAKGQKKGYAEAAADILPVLEGIIAEIQAQEGKMQDLLKEIQDGEKDLEDEINEAEDQSSSEGDDDLVPLDLGES